MDIKLLSPLWGHDHLPAQVFLDQVRSAGYHGIDTWVPADKVYRHTMYDYIHRHGMALVTHQHNADGSTFAKFRQSFVRNLHRCAEASPLLINSHTGKDYFSIQQHIDLIDTAEAFSAKTGIAVAHETHRGRLGYCPQMMEMLFALRSAFCVTADLSHWVCVTESMLENFTAAVDETIQRSRHIHARVGFEQGPQVSDPRASEYKYALDRFLGWWDSIVSVNRAAGRDTLTITTEFGPPPYMPVTSFAEGPSADQFELNVFMKDLLYARYVLVT